MIGGYAALVTSWLEEIEYRTGWTLTINDDPALDLVALVVKAKVEDARRPGRHADVNFILTVPPYLEQASQFYDWLHYALHTGPEAHETAEWLRWRTSHQPVFDPHRGDVR